MSLLVVRFVASVRSEDDSGMQTRDSFERHTIVTVDV
jgi:hypothetical protein